MTESTDAINWGEGGGLHWYSLCSAEQMFFICLGNHMILSAIWDKSAQVNFSKTNEITRAYRTSAICSL